MSVSVLFRALQEAEGRKVAEGVHVCKVLIPDMLGTLGK